VIVAAQAAVAVLGIVALRAYTELAPAAVFGASNLILGAMGLGLQLFVGGFTAVQLRYYSTAQSEGSAGDELTGDTMWFSLGSTTVLTVCAIAVWGVLRVRGQTSYGWLVVGGGAVWLFAMTARYVLMSGIQAARRQATYAALQVVEATLLLLATAVSLWLSPRVESYLLGQAIAVVGLLLIIVTKDRGALKFFRLRSLERRSRLPRGAWRYGLPFAPLSFLGWLANMGDRYTVAALLGAESAGRYVAPFSIASRGAVLLNSALCDLFRPLLFDAANRGDGPETRRIFWRWMFSSATLSSVAVSCVYFGSGILARLLLAPPYRSGAADIMLWVASGYAVYGVTQIFETRILLLGYPGWLLAPMIVGGLANIGFSIALVLRGGVLGAAQATCLSFVVQLLTTLLVLGRAQRRGESRLLRDGGLEIA
jgi:O-antigen/teichoic acid export membrane protein